MTSALNSKMLEMTNRKPKGIYISSYFALSSFAIEALKNYASPFPSLLGYLMQITNKVANVEVEHRKRIAGSGNYTLIKLIKLWLQGMTNFSLVPLRIASFVGMISALIGIISGVVLIIRRLIYPNIALGYTSLMATILLVGGLLMIMLGILGEYVGRIYILLSNMPQYSVREIFGSDLKENAKK